MKLGWSNYIAMFLSATAYITIIYTLLLSQLIPQSPYVYLGIFIIIIILSAIVGHLMQSSGLWSREHAISMENNPYKDMPIGKKEILSYDATILGYEMTIFGYESTIINLQNLIEIDKKLGIPADSLIENIKGQEEMCIRAKDMLEKMKEMRATAKEGLV